ncbi:MAG TPA: histidine kinase [Dyadobacter sp.]|jgi:sensor histidine kinase YesM|nr:histidine kinase [Dyadobacter sp.]
MSCSNTSITDNNKFWNFSPGFFGINLLIALGITALFTPARYYADAEGLEKVGYNLIITFLLSVGLSYGGYITERFFNSKMPWIHHPVKRLMLQSVSYMAYSFLISYVLILIYALVRKFFTWQNIPWRELVGDTKQPMLIAFFVTAVLISRSFLLQWRKAAIEAEQLKTEQFAQQYQSLKDQLNPHFLFNSLNVLSDLVYDNPDTAAVFIRQLSKIYRYVLDVQQEELVLLQKEVEFAENYLALQKIRFEDGLQYSISIEKDTPGFLPPLSLQLLLENAIKHNEASRAKPLAIAILLNNGHLIVRNNLQPKKSVNEESAGIGLANIEKRYALLSSENMTIKDADGYFEVELPILKLNGL